MGQSLAALGYQVGDTITLPTTTMILAVLGVSQALPLATQADVEAAIAKVADLDETEFAAQPRDAKAFVSEAIDAVRDLEETDFAAEPRDNEAAVVAAIAKVRDLEATDFSKVFD